MFRLFITQEDVISATWWNCCPSYPDDRLHDMWTPDPWSYLITTRMNERLLSKEDHEKQSDWTPGVKFFLIEFFWSILSPRRWPLNCCLWCCSDALLRCRGGSASSSASLTEGFFNKYSKQLRGRGHCSVDVSMASLIAHPSCHRAVIKVISSILVVLCWKVWILWQHVLKINTPLVKSFG